jgi:hypothetical protein
VIPPVERRDRQPAAAALLLEPLSELLEPLSELLDDEELSLDDELLSPDDELLSPDGELFSPFDVELDDELVFVPRLSVL